MSSQHSVVSWSLHSDELDEPDSPPPRPAGLWRTTSFYFTFDGHQIGPGHTLSAVPRHDDYGNNHGTDIAEDLPIDENSPSEDERFAEAVIQGMYLIFES